MVRSNSHIKSGTILVVSTMLINILNLLFNIYLGRVLTFEQFGLVGLFNSFSYTVMILFVALHATVNQRVAFLTAHYNYEAGYYFLRSIWKKAFLVGLGISIVWLFATPYINAYFHTDYYISLPFTPIILLGFVAYSNSGYLKGVFSFTAAALTIISEAVVKLFIAWLLVDMGMREWAYLSIPISAIVAFTLSGLIIWSKHRVVDSHKEYAFPKRFFTAAVVAGLASMAFLTFDLMLAKHFLSPNAAGQYALLSLIGKMFYFFGTIPNLFLVTLVSYEIGQGKTPNATYNKLLLATIILLATSYAGLLLTGHQILPLILGPKVVAIFPYLNLYATAISLLVVSGSLTAFHLVREQYLFPIISIVSAVLMCVGLAFFHADIYQFTYVILYASLAGLAVTAVLHLLEARGVLKLKEGL